MHCKHANIHCKHGLDKQKVFPHLMSKTQEHGYDTGKLRRITSANLKFKPNSMGSCKAKGIQLSKELQHPSPIQKQDLNHCTLMPYIRQQMITITIPESCPLQSSKICSQFLLRWHFHFSVRNPNIKIKLH